MANDDIGGVWRTVGGRRIFIKDGQDLKDAMDKSGKFGKTSKAKDLKSPKKDDKKYKAEPNKLDQEMKERMKEWEKEYSKRDYKDEVEKGTKEIEKRMGTEVKEFKREDYNMDKVRDRGKVNEKEAKECVKLADKVFNKAMEKEPKITRDVVDSVKQFGAKMDGLDFRIKQPTSLAAKIGDDAKTDGIKFEKAAGNIKDAVRYTAIINEKDFVKGYNNIKQSLESKGYKEDRCKNFYQMYKDNEACQKAVQCVYSTSDGYKFELQYHTTNSQGAKEFVNHKMYEEAREKTTAYERVVFLEQQMTKVGTYVSEPPDVYTIKTHK